MWFRDIILPFLKIFSSFFLSMSLFFLRPFTFSLSFFLNFSQFSVFLSISLSLSNFFLLFLYFFISLKILSNFSSSFSLFLYLSVSLFFSHDSALSKVLIKLWRWYDYQRRWYYLKFHHKIITKHLSDATYSSTCYIH